MGWGSHQGSTRPLRKQRELRKHQAGDFVVVLVTEQAWWLCLGIWVWDLLVGIILVDSGAEGLPPVVGDDQGWGGAGRGAADDQEGNSGPAC